MGLFTPLFIFVTFNRHKTVSECYQVTVQLSNWILRGSDSKDVVVMATVRMVLSWQQHTR